MPLPRTIALALPALTLVACSSEPTVSVDQLREAAEEAGESPSACPLDVDVPAALEEAGIDEEVEPGEAAVEVSQTGTPAEDPVEAQQGGMSAIDAAAGAYVSCDYSVGDGTLTVRLTVAPGDRAAAVYLLAPLVLEASSMDADDVQAYLDEVTDEGSVALASGDEAAMTVVPTEGSGGAALLVTGDTVTGDGLRTATEELEEDISGSGS
jgi:hypothetical protein